MLLKCDSLVKIAVPVLFFFCMGLICHPGLGLLIFLTPSLPIHQSLPSSADADTRDTCIPMGLFLLYFSSLNLTKEIKGAKKSPKEDTCF